MLLTPSWRPAKGMERIMLLKMWADQLQDEMSKGVGENRPDIIIAGIGKPTFPISPDVVQTMLSYWEQIAVKTRTANHFLTGEHEHSRSTRNKVAQYHAAIDYGHPMGDREARARLAMAFNRWYGHKIDIKDKHVLFTVGGLGALFITFQVLQRRYPGGKIVTPFPHYALYPGPHHCNKLYPIDVMQEKGYRLTAKALAHALHQAEKEAKQEGVAVSAFLLCDPNNPLGTALDETEMHEIAEVLRRYPDLLIILDEAYAEMRYHRGHPISLLSAAPDLAHRFIVIRSATKGLSAAGERMAALLAFDETLMLELIEENISICGHAPHSAQFAFAEAMYNLSETELSDLRNYYHPQVKYVATRLANMGAALPDQNYRVDGTFYIVGDFSDLIGMELPPETQRAIHKTGLATTDEDIAYALLFEDGLMITPLSYFGLAPSLGLLRITCSDGDEVLKELMDRLEFRLEQVRKMRK